MRRVAIGFQMSLGVSDAFRLKWRVAMVWLHVVMAVAATVLAVAVSGDAIETLAHARALRAGGAVSFALMYPDQGGDGQPGEPSTGMPKGELDTVLRSVLALDGAGTATYLAYPGDTPRGNPVTVLFGKTVQVVGVGQSLGPGLWLGADITDIAVGDTVDIGFHRVAVAGRLPATAAVLDATSPWSVAEPLANRFVFVTDYGGYVDTARSNDPGVLGLSAILSSLVLLNPSQADVAAVVRAVATTEVSLGPGGMRAVPRKVGESEEYVRNVRSSILLTTLAVVMVLLAGVATYSAIRRMVSLTLADYGVHRLCGGTLVDIAVRSATFATLAVFGPAIPVLLFWALVPHPTLARSLWLLPVFLLALVLAVAVCAATVVRRVHKDALQLATRSME
jgi:hypothetical protein